MLNIQSQFEHCIVKITWSKILWSHGFCRLAANIFDLLANLQIMKEKGAGKHTK